MFFFTLLGTPCMVSSTKHHPTAAPKKVQSVGRFMHVL